MKDVVLFETISKADAFDPSDRLTRSKNLKRSNIRHKKTMPDWFWFALNFLENYHVICSALNLISLLYQSVLVLCARPRFCSMLKPLQGEDINIARLKTGHHILWFVKPATRWPHVTFTKLKACSCWGSLLFENYAFKNFVSFAVKLTMDTEKLIVFKT